LTLFFCSKRRDTKAYPGKLVSYKSRANESIEQIKLTGWWLPAPNKNAPRVVIQHGFKGTSNEWRQTFWAYQFLSLNISVLLNNFRDHCYSDDSKARIYEWGHAYPYDLLGAWDFATMDPTGELGGSRPKDKVGLVGLSKGAFTALNAIALEKDVPAAFVDSPPYDPKAAAQSGLQNALGGVITALFVNQVWNGVLRAAAQKGLDLEKHTPEKMFPQAPNTRRPIWLEANKQDTTVPIVNYEKYVALFDKYPKKFNVTGSHVGDKTCNGVDHGATSMLEPVAYLRRICEFWRPVFGLDDISCMKADLVVPQTVSEEAKETVLL